MLKRLGQPAFLPGIDLAQLLGPTYEAITQAAIAAAFDGGQGNQDKLEEEWEINP
ncbi:MAG: hypothetical protein J7M34_08330 [Anaerolineae bacterium]|nr:hypothetical protein [Anaerolineae bacterium]